ncbi:MAG: LysM peptidoglycan-binding domain-containing protein [Candidatus Micrarchaeia archaeon]|jgi:LysM repeat protein
MHKGLAAVFAAAFFVLIFAGSAQALCICQGGPQSVSCKACGSPASSAAAVSYTVKPGQLLSDIAKECSVDVETIKQANALSDGAVLQGGQVLQIPGGKCGGTPSSGGGSGSVGASGCYADLVKAAGQRHGLDGCLLLAIMKTESGCNKNAVGGDGECGLMQVMPQWFQNHAGWSGGNGIMPYNYYPSPKFDEPKSCYIPANNIDAGARVFKRYWNGDKTRSLCAYNTGSHSSGCPYAPRVLSKYNPNC